MISRAQAVLGTGGSSRGDGGRDPGPRTRSFNASLNASFIGTTKHDDKTHDWCPRILRARSSDVEYIEEMPLGMVPTWCASGVPQMCVEIAVEKKKNGSTDFQSDHYSRTALRSRRP